MFPGRQELFLLAPYLITALGMYLSIHFHRGRPFMALLLLVIFYWCSRRYLIGRSLELSLNELYQAFVLLIPANIALIAVMRERGVFSPAGRLRLLFLAVQMFIAFWFFRYNFIASLPVRRQVPVDAGLLGALIAFCIASNWRYHGSRAHLCPIPLKYIACGKHVLIEAGIGSARVIENVPV